MTEYRYRAEPGTEYNKAPQIFRFEVLRTTPMGVVINQVGFSLLGCHQKPEKVEPKLIIERRREGPTKRRFAWPTEDEAIVSLVARTRERIRLLERDLAYARQCLPHAEAEMERRGLSVPEAEYEESHRELDRRLCERLGIPPDLPSRHIMHDYAGRPQMCDCGARSFEDRIADEPCIAHPAVYPPLSTTGDGMVLLMEALANLGRNFAIGHRDGLYDAAVNQAGKNSQAARAEHAPLALALAAAAALQIEVADPSST